MKDRDRNKYLSTLLADWPHPARFSAPSAVRAAQVRWLLDLADHIDALELTDTAELAATARNTAFQLVRDSVDDLANRPAPVLPVS